MQEDIWEKFEHDVYALGQTKCANCEILHNRPIYVYDITQKALAGMCHADPMKP